MKTDISNNYLLIQGWMLTKLGLKGSELLLYALIYGFSQDGHSAFSGSVEYMQEWIGASSKQTVYNAINNLIDRGLIFRRVVCTNGARGVEYGVVAGDNGSPKNGHAVPKVDKDSPKNGLKQSKKWTEAVQKMESYINKDNINNKYNNTIGDNNIPSSAAADGESVSADGGKVIEIKRTSVPSSTELSKEFEQAWELYPRKEGKEQARRAYVSIRRSGVSADTIRASIVAYNARIAREQIEPRYVTHGGNWFSGRRWEDKPPQASEVSVHRGVKPPRALAYRQQHYTREQLAALGVDFGEDVYVDV